MRRRGGFHARPDGMRSSQRMITYVLLFAVYFCTPCRRRHAGRRALIVGIDARRVAAAR
ncbi:hypothetical protein C7S17_2497 [Burkholderia thailandensis]|nr:hypothetical protein [Burkholderia thailandensis]